MATQGSLDLHESTVKQNSAVFITGVNSIAPNFVTLVATYIYGVRQLMDKNRTKRETRNRQTNRIIPSVKNTVI